MSGGVTKIIKSKFELGIGLGLQYNTFTVPASTFTQWVDITSFPIYALGRYYLNDDSFRIYVKGVAGFANNTRSWSVTEVNNGVMFEGGLGVSFASKYKSKWYIELAQYTSHAKGTSTRRDWSNGWDQPSVDTNIDFSVWFNRLVFKVGFLFGK